MLLVCIYIRKLILEAHVNIRCKRDLKASEEEWVNRQTTKARVVRYAIIQSPQWFSELTHSSSEASIYKSFINRIFIDKINKENYNGILLNSITIYKENHHAIV